MTKLKTNGTSVVCYQRRSYQMFWLLVTIEKKLKYWNWKHGVWLCILCTVVPMCQTVDNPWFKKWHDLSNYFNRIPAKYHMNCFINCVIISEKERFSAQLSKCVYIMHLHDNMHLSRDSLQQCCKMYTVLQHCWAILWLPVKADYSHISSA